MSSRQLATQVCPNLPQETIQSHEEKFSRLASMVFGLDEQVRMLQSRHDELWQDHTSLRAEVESMLQSLNCSPALRSSEKLASSVSDGELRPRSHDPDENEHGISLQDNAVEGEANDSVSPQELLSPDDELGAHRRSKHDHIADTSFCESDRKEYSNAVHSPDDSDRKNCEPNQATSPAKQESSVRRLLRSPRIVNKPRKSYQSRGSLQSFSQSFPLSTSELPRQGSPSDEALAIDESFSNESSPQSRSECKCEESDPAPDLYELAKPLFQQDSNSQEKLHTLRIVQQLLSVSPEPPNSWSGPGTPLAMAVSFGQTDLVRLLLRSRANPNEKGDKGVTPLHSATFEGNLELCRLLLVARASINTCDQHEQSPLFFAPTVEIAKLLIGRAADVYKRNGKGQSALHLAGRAGFREVLKWFAANVDTTLVELRDSHGMTALQYLNLERKKASPLASAASLRLEHKRAEEHALVQVSPLKASPREDGTKNSAGRDTRTALNQLAKQSHRESDVSSWERGRKAAKQLQSQRENEKLLALYRSAAKNAEAVLLTQAKLQKIDGENNDSPISPHVHSTSSSDIRQEIEMHSQGTREENSFEDSYDCDKVELPENELDLSISEPERGFDRRNAQWQQRHFSNAQATSSRALEEDDVEQIARDRRLRSADEKMQSKLFARRLLVEQGSPDELQENGLQIGVRNQMDEERAERLTDSDDKNPQ